MNSKIIDNFQYKKDRKNIIDSGILDRIKGKNILILGGSGVLGSYIVKTIIDYNIEHRLNDRIRLCVHIHDKKKEKKIFGNLLENASVIYGDVCDMEEIPSDTDIVIYSIGITDSFEINNNPTCVIKPCIIGLTHILELCRKSKIEQFLFFSSSAVYGRVEESILYENRFGILDFSNPSNMYAESKRIGEAICMSYFRKYKIPVKIIRPFHMLGPGMQGYGSGYIKEMIIKIIEGNDIILHGTGQEIRNYTYDKNAIFQIFLVINEGGYGEIYNIGSDQNLSTEDFVKMLIECSGKDIKMSIENDKSKKLMDSQNNDYTPYIGKTLSLLKKDYLIKYNNLHEDVETWFREVMI